MAFHGWRKKPLRGLHDDGDEVADRKVRPQKQPLVLDSSNNGHWQSIIPKPLPESYTLKVIKKEPPVCHSDTIRLDPDNILQETGRQRFRVLHTTHDSVF